MGKLFVRYILSADLHLRFNGAAINTFKVRVLKAISYVVLVPDNYADTIVEF